MLPLHPALLSQPDYLFSQIAAAAEEERKRHPHRRVISLGIGDVTQPIAPVAAAALRTAAAELATQKGQKGYGPAAGYPFLREAIAAQYADLPCPIPPEEVTVTAGSKEALGALFSLWEPGVPVWVCDPVYPAYRAQAEAAGHPVFSLPCRAENDFLPQPEEAAKPGLIVLCTPNNPTGAALSLVEMTEWVNWANRTGSLLLVDTAYAAFLSGEELPRSIYAVPGAKRCAIEVGSFSKSDGFTGVRCGWVILPRETGCAAAWQRWHQLSHPAGRGGRPFPHRTAAAAKGPCPLPAECRHHAANVSQAGAHLCRPPSRLPGPLPLGPLSGWPGCPKQLGLVPPPAGGLRCSLRPGGRLWADGRGLAAVYRLLPTGGHRRGSAEDGTLSAVGRPCITRAERAAAGRGFRGRTGRASPALRGAAAPPPYRAKGTGCAPGQVPAATSK